MDCRKNKDLNPKTCRYVKECKPGQVRDDKFRCKSLVRRVYKSKAVSRNKLKNLKTLVNSDTSLTPNNLTVKPVENKTLKSKTSKNITSNIKTNKSKIPKKDAFKEKTAKTTKQSKAKSKPTLLTELTNENGPKVRFQSNPTTLKRNSPTELLKKDRLIDYIAKFIPSKKTTLKELAQPAIDAGIIENNKPDIGLLKELVKKYFSRS